MDPSDHRPGRGMLPADPVDQFARWMADVVAAGLPEPTAMVLATVSAAGRPRARTVLLKELRARRASSSTPTAPRARASDLAGAAAGLPAVPLVRDPPAGDHRGPGAARCPPSESEPYFHSRPRGSQLGAWASRQSSVLGVPGRAGGAVRRAGAALAGGDGGADAGVLGRLPGRCRRSWSSGRAGRTGCTTGSATAVTARLGDRAPGAVDPRPARLRGGRRPSLACRVAIARSRHSIR